MGPSCVENDFLTCFRISGELKDTSYKTEFWLTAGKPAYAAIRLAGRALKINWGLGCSLRIIYAGESALGH